MRLGEAELEAIAARTLADYNNNADAFREGTQDHDVSQNIAALLSHIRCPPPFTLLDFGCGPGRDLKALKALGHRPIGLDGSERFVAMDGVLSSPGPSGVFCSSSSPPSSSSSSSPISPARPKTSIRSTRASSSPPPT